MKLRVQQSIFFPALQSVARSCGIRSTLPVLANILLQTQNGQLKLSATNLELGVIKTVAADITTEGEITIPSRTLLDIISGLSGEIDLEASGELLKISTSKFNATLNGVSSSEFPTIPTSSEKAVLVDGKLLEKILPQISFAAAADEGRPILTGILTEIKKDSLELVATDGFRLAHQTTKLEGADGVSIKSLIPRRTFEEIVRLISEEDEIDKVEISSSENQNQVVFKINQTIASSRLIEGNFPSWEKIIPEKSVNRTVVDRSEFLKGVKLASVFAKDSANIVKVITLSSGLKLTSEAKELGEQEGSVEAQVEGDEITVAFNAKFLIDALSACSSSQVVIEFSGNLSPALIKPMGQEGLEYVIMPVRLS